MGNDCREIAGATWLRKVWQARGEAFTATQDYYRTKAIPMSN